MLKTLIVLCCFPLFTIASETAPHSAPSHGGGEKQRWKPLYEPKVSNKDFATRPGKIEIISPEWFGSAEGAVTLKWSASEGAEAYFFQVATDANFKWLLVSEPLLRATEYKMKNLGSNQSYFWRVAGLKPRNDNGYLKGDFSKSMFQTK